MAKKFTEFEKKVYRRVLEIPLGSTITYEELARQIGHPNAARAVGNALKKNPYTLLIPCHRVVAKNGIGGYSRGAKEKKHLLELEKEIKEMLYGNDV